MRIMQRTGLTRIVRATTALLAMLLAIAAIGISTAEPASAHKGHMCPGKKSRGYSCKIEYTGLEERHVFAYYNGKPKTEGGLYFVRGTRFLKRFTVCDQKAGDGVYPRLDITTKNGKTYAYKVITDTKRCADITSGFAVNRNVERFRLTNVKGSGKISHSTRWW